MNRNATIAPPHPVETIKEDYLVPPGMSVNRLAASLGVGESRRPVPLTSMLWAS